MHRRREGGTLATDHGTRGYRGDMNILGIDIGGTGIKGAPVDTVRGALLEERRRVPTPSPPKPNAVLGALADVVAHFGAGGPLGITFPGVVKHGSTCSAANMDPAWVGLAAEDFFSQRLGLPVVLLNDADAAGLGEMRFGAGRGVPGTVVMLTFGTGIGSAVFHNGVLLPNSELGHLKIRGRIAESRCSARVREQKALSFVQWAGLVAEYINTLDGLFSPELIIIGGGVSKRADQFLPELSKLTSVRLEPAALRNRAGIIGAACQAAEAAAAGK